MAAHKLRTGQLRVCFTCKQVPHQECMTVDPEIAEVIVCHCPVCQPACTRTECQPENLKGGRRRRPAAVCPSCHLAHAGECL
ncbi:hypothetical protein AB0B89_35800 [Sphaerisporangium sp. NPDC049002]|uniref:hypothetical protein n=1 Tax=Sphaerisporangium sp. NPDC049002 TaxID=3155392 RepID=UPI0033FBC0E5